MENIYRYFNCKIRQVLEKYEIKNIYEIINYYNISL